MKKGKIVFTGNFWEYFVISLGLLVLSIFTFGLLLPYYFYWIIKYFFTRMELVIDDSSREEEFAK